MSQVNCKTCGAPTNSLVAHCEYCGVEMTKASSISPEEYINALSKSLATAISKATKLYTETAKKDAITQFPVPSDLPRLVAFFSYTSSNDVEIGADTSEVEGHVIRAWRGKAAAAYQQLQFAAMNDAKLLEVLRIQASRYSPEALERRRKNEDRRQNLMLLGIVVVLLLIFLGIGIYSLLEKHQ